MVWPKATLCQRTISKFTAWTISPRLRTFLSSLKSKWGKRISEVLSLEQKSPRVFFLQKPVKAFNQFLIHYLLFSIVWNRFQLSVTSSQSWLEQEWAQARGRRPRLKCRALGHDLKLQALKVGSNTGLRVGLIAWAQILGSKMVSKARLKSLDHSK